MYLIGTFQEVLTDVKGTAAPQPSWVIFTTTATKSSTVVKTGIEIVVETCEHGDSMGSSDWVQLGWKRTIFDFGRGNFE